MRIPARTTPHQFQEAHDGPPAPLPPLWWLRRFPGQAPQVAVMRSWIATLLPACDPLDDLLVLASELASNAVTHTHSGHRDGWFTVEVTWTPAAARVVVGDQGSDDVPASKASLGDEAADLESGRGLLLVSALSAAWGIAGDAEARWLWAEVDWRSQRGPLPASPLGSGPVPLTPGRHPDMTKNLCTCGYQAEDSDDLAIHFGEMFIPDDDTAPDGQVHNELARDTTIPRDTPEPLILTCRCGFTGTAGAFDHHLLDVFTPADSVGTDGKQHAPTHSVETT